MSALSQARHAGSASEGDLFERLRDAIPEGWSSLVLLLLMLLSVGWALDDAGWAGLGADGKSATGFLPAAVVLGGLWGLLGAKSRYQAATVHLGGAVVATLYLLVTVAGVLSTSPSLERRMHALNVSMGQFYQDLFVSGIRSAEISAFLIVMGAIAWTTGHFAAFNLFRRRRPLTVVLVTGLVMLIEVSASLKAQYHYLILFAAAALLLLVRMNLLDQRHGWAERRIGESDYLSELFMRSGASFVAVALLGSVVLAATASSAPLAAVWRDADDQLVGLGNELNRIVGGVTGAARGPSGLFSSAQTIRGVWESSGQVAFRFASSDGRGHYWRAATYDAFDGTTWQQLDRVDGSRVEAGSPLLGGTVERVGEEGRHRVDLTVTAIDLPGDVLLAPEAPLAVDRAAEVVTSTPRGPVALIELAERVRSGEGYTVSALVRNEGEENGGLTANRLAAAGLDYPAWTRRYVAIREGSIGELTRQTSDAIVAELPEDERDPYHVAEAVQRYLYRTGGFRYRTDVRGLCGNERVVDCFLRTRVGYCEHFATAMVMLLRAQQIPARMAMGYLPGKALGDGQWEVDRGAAHAWAEVYFPGYGWVRFDPTPGNRENGQTPTSLDEGRPVPTPAPEQGAAAAPETPRFDRDPEEDEEGLQGSSPDPAAATGPTDAQGSGGAGGLLPVVILGLFLLAVGLVVFARRRPGAAPPPDVVYRGVARLAGRFGYGPRPTQTAYEYAGTLGALVPAVRTELHVVARAKVESAYAGRPVADDLLRDLVRAYRRLRVGLLRLAVRRTRQGRAPIVGRVRRRSG